MEVLGLPVSPLISTPFSYNHNSHCNNHRLGKTQCFTSSSLIYKPFHQIQYKSGYRGIIRAQAVDEDYELKQVKDMAAARKRWESLVREGKVSVLTPREAGYAIQLSGKTLLDVRPSMEHEKAWVKGSTWVPIFDVDTTIDAGTLSRKVTSYMMGGWWSGVPTLSYNNQFIPKVTEKFPKDTDLIVACQKGLRSLAACELLYNAGYRNLFWVQGGLEAAEEEDLERGGPQPFKFAGIGGLSEFLGWTDQQRAQAAKEGWGYRLVFSARLIGVVLAADALFIGVQQVARYLQDLRAN
ncbi:rhodanese-like domain-containing protein 11, chloroplastic [Cynara cardunculus var. scolymus]|uniref:rhodanese-like domain-containing protein 11, chloroplastic n=1 Tax=Cynara cardunculus var. scolymus TaxID=59895 RepID=UPI000D62EFEA|nr:rhodanese-like domain-containing protein 11, chloroplastic [Cynara cardunculus var. scolymus]